jgi:hypothetical protein
VAFTVNNYIRHVLQWHLRYLVFGLGVLVRCAR